MEGFGHIKAAKGHIETFLRMIDGGGGNMLEGGGGVKTARHPWWKWEDQSRVWWQSAVPCCAAQIKTG